MSKSDHRPHLARAVTRKHAERFAEEWRKLAQDDADTFEALFRTGILGARDDGDEDARARFDAIAEEIVVRFTATVQPAIADAFLKVAREVLRRERRVPR